MNGVAVYVHELTTLTRDDLDSAGGKGANLGELLAGGFDVPPGFVIDTDAYTAATAAWRDRLLDLVPGQDASSAAFEAAAGQIAALFAQSVPADIADQIMTAWRALGSPSVAVRSSATAEDLADASFAGQQLLGLAVDGSGDGLPVWPGR